MTSLFVIPKHHPYSEQDMKKMLSIIKRHNGTYDGPEIDVVNRIYSWWIIFKTRKSARSAASSLQAAGFKTRYKIPHAKSLKNMGK